MAHKMVGWNVTRAHSVALSVISGCAAVDDYTIINVTAGHYSSLIKCERALRSKTIRKKMNKFTTTTRSTTTTTNVQRCKNSESQSQKMLLNS